jgi:hypothetical protein
MFAANIWATWETAKSLDVRPPDSPKPNRVETTRTCRLKRERDVPQSLECFLQQRLFRFFSISNIGYGESQIATSIVPRHGDDPMFGN